MSPISPDFAVKVLDFGELKGESKSVLDIDRSQLDLTFGKFPLPQLKPVRELKPQAAKLLLKLRCSEDRREHIATAARAPAVFGNQQ